MIKGQPHILNYLVSVSGYVMMFNVFIEKLGKQEKQGGWGKENM